MLEEILSTAIGVIVTGTIGYLVGIIRNYKIKDKNQEEALKCLLRSNITSKYYVYKQMKHIPGYEKQNINYMFEQYQKMGGNSYVSEIVKELNQLPPVES